VSELATHMSHPVQEERVELAIQHQFRSHMDVVRGIHFVSEIESLVTVSEDCTVKLWSLKGLEVDAEPYVTLRGHTGPLFAVAGGHPQHKRVVFTAGSEGSIRVWNLPAIGDVN